VSVPSRLTLSGRLARGKGEGASFTRLPWAREQFLSRLGIDPFPGTLNLALDAACLPGWQALRASPGVPVVPPVPDWCEGRCYPVRVEGRVPGAIVFPGVPAYPEDQLELIASVSLRETLPRSEGDPVSVELCRPLHARAVLFDVDGTLVDSLPAIRIVAERAAAAHGLSIGEDLVRRALNRNELFWDLIVLPDDPDRLRLIESLKQAARREWPGILGEHGSVFPGLRATLERLRAAGARLGIVTGARRGTFEPLRREGLMGFFEAVLTRADVERAKPDPEGLLKCAAALGIEPGEAVYVGDTPLDVQAARAAGMGAIAVLSGAGDSALLSLSFPDRIVHTLAGLDGVLEIG
jgi:HAD superfamily hydrolase (TIGR01509 family)